MRPTPFTHESISDPDSHAPCKNQKLHDKPVRAFRNPVCPQPLNRDACSTWREKACHVRKDRRFRTRTILSNKQIKTENSCILCDGRSVAACGCERGSPVSVVSLAPSAQLDDVAGVSATGFDAVTSKIKGV